MEQNDEIGKHNDPDHWKLQNVLTEYSRLLPEPMLIVIITCTIRNTVIREIRNLRWPMLLFPYWPAGRKSVGTGNLMLTICSHVCLWFDNRSMPWLH